MAKAIRNHYELVQRFYSYVTPGEDGCWLWTGCTDKDGYGKFWSAWDRGWSDKAHRFSYQLIMGDIPKGLTLDHMCAVKNCVNPDHLQALTPSDHNRLEHERGVMRQAKGEDQGKSKLTESQVLEICERYAEGGVTQAELADEYGMGRQAISDIATGKHWGWLTGRGQRQ